MLWLEMSALPDLTGSDACVSAGEETRKSDAHR